ncbi:MAG: site-specific integrase [Alphaproteobacteria bacterium]|nr:site-specific integrase [Alphaproteobacteria bacterium]
MARTNRANALDNRTARLKLPLQKRFYAGIGGGLALCYRRDGKGVGTWTARIGFHEYKTRLIGEADDFKDADGETVFTYFQAAEKAREFEKEYKTDAGLITAPLTVAKAAEEYLNWYKLNRKSFKTVSITVNAYILPVFGDRLINDLTTLEIKRWLERLAEQPRRKRTKLFDGQAFLPPPQTDEEKRARKSTANRILTVFKAILNKAFYDGKAASDTAWRRVKPFSKVDQARIRFLKPYEVEFLLNVSEPDFKDLIQGALFTGARYGELAKMRVSDFMPDQGFVYIQPGKSGKGRHIPLPQEGMTFFESLTAGKTGSDFVFTRRNGKQWGKNDQQRPMFEACRKAKIEPVINFHELRHTYASMLAQRGVDLLTISKLLGHADTRITSKHYAHLCDTTLREAVAKLPFTNQRENKIVAIR